MIKVRDMTTQHIINRIAWLKRQKVDSWAVYGDRPEFDGSLMAHDINDWNDRIDKEVVKLEKELEGRDETNR